MTHPVTFAVVGEALIDLVDPADGTPALAHPGGSPLNVAVGLARLGQRARFAGRFSRDPFGTLLRNHASRAGVDLSHAVVDPDRPSTIASVYLDEGVAEYHFYVEKTADFFWTRPELTVSISDADVVHYGSLTSWLPPGDRVVAELIAEVWATGRVLISYDPNVRPTLQTDVERARQQVETAVGTAHVVKASSEDLAYLYGDRPLDDIAAEWQAWGPRLVVITRGGDGSVVYLAGAEPFPQPIHRLPLVDTVGAGDSFMSGLLDGLARTGLAAPQGLATASREQIADIVDRAALISAITCSRAGANPPTAAEVDAARAGGR